ncbi:hypothetical protein BHE74_00042769 [Ensete ventricosum]|nr:hypothetical protein BHE74_00042769 [Ensete ventricosum]
MPQQDRAPVKDADIELMSMNLKEGGRCVVNHNEDLTTVDFGGNVSLAEKEATVLAKKKGAGMAGRGGVEQGKRNSMDEAEGRSYSVSIAPRKKTLATLKEEVRILR